MRVWYGGADKARVAVNDQYAETDVVSNGTDVWTYDSRAKTATHTTLPAADASKADRKAPERRPADAAAGRAGGPRQGSPRPPTSGSTPTSRVAGQAAYDLVLTPKDGASLVKQVRIAVDGANFVPLRVQVFGAGDKAAIDVAYTDIAFGQPDARMFAFNAPEGTKVTEKAVPERKAPTAAEKKALEARKAQAQKDTTTVGTGWSTVGRHQAPERRGQRQRDAQGLPRPAEAGLRLVGHRA